MPFSPDKNVTPVFSNNRTEESNSEYQAAATSTSKKQIISALKDEPHVLKKRTVMSEENNLL